MDQRVTKVRVKQINGSFGDAVPIGVESRYVTMQGGSGLEDIIRELRSSITVHETITKQEYEDDFVPLAGRVYFVH